MLKKEIAKHQDLKFLEAEEKKNTYTSTQLRRNKDIKIRTNTHSQGNTGMRGFVKYQLREINWFYSLILKYLKTVESRSFTTSGPCRGEGCSAPGSQPPAPSSGHFGLNLWLSLGPDTPPWSRKLLSTITPQGLTLPSIPLPNPVFLIRKIS